MFTRWLLVFAYFLKSSTRYKRFKLGGYNLLENRQSQHKTFFDIFMIGLILISVSLLIYESRHRGHVYIILFEYGVMSVLILEYCLRLWLHGDMHEVLVEEYEKAQYLNRPFNIKQPLARILRNKVAYLGSPPALIDLLAIVPSIREIAILRVFVIFRLFKIFRYFDSVKIFSDVLVSKRFELLTLMLIMGALVIIASVAIYLFENPTQGGQIQDLFSGFYWAIITISTVGYGDIAPHSVPGRIVAMLLVVSGISGIAFFTSIIVSDFEDKLLILRENKIFTELKRLRDYVIICGYGRIGQEIAEELARNKQTFIIIDPDEHRVAMARRQNYLCIQGDACKNEVLLNAGIQQNASVLVCCTGDDVANVYISLSSRYLNDSIRIISRANKAENEKKLYQAGADFVVRPFEIAGLLAAEYLGQPVAFEAILGLLREDRRIRLEAVLIHPGSFVEQQRIDSLKCESKKLKLLGVISANTLHARHKNAYKMKNAHFYFNPDPGFILQARDILVLLGHQYSIDQFKNMLEKSSLKRA